MWKLSLLTTVISLVVASCASDPYSKPSALRFQNNKQGYNQEINVNRDAKLCAGIQEMNRVAQFISILTVLNQVNSISIIRQSII